jgi:hypothetical protein
MTQTHLTFKGTKKKAKVNPYTEASPKHTHKTLFANLTKNLSLIAKFAKHVKVWKTLAYNSFLLLSWTLCYFDQSLLCA